LAFVIVVGNEKGGSGKSTTSMHVVVALLRLGRKVAIVDLDVRQRTLMRYLENRVAWAERSGARPAFPEGLRIEEEDLARDPEGEVIRALDHLAEHEFVLVDAPGQDNPASRAAHARADLVITPLNDSFLDFDVLGRVDPETYQVTSISDYSAMVFDAKKQRALAKSGSEVDWVVVRNRLPVREPHNKRRVGAALDALARRAGFRVVPGLSDRVVFKEMFPRGLTLLDEPEGKKLWNMSRVAARQELRELIGALDLPGVDPQQL
jgi:chromosome partitioning protein